MLSVIIEKGRKKGKKKEGRKKRGTGKFLDVTDMFITLIVVVVLQMYTCI